MYENDPEYRQSVNKIGEDFAGKITAALVDPIDREEFVAMRREVAEMHAMMTQLAAIVNQMQGNPMLSAFLPRGL